MPVVKLYANLRELAGKKELLITGAVLGEILKELVVQHPALGEAILENGTFCQHVVVTVNGHNVSDLSMQVADKDVIAIFPPIAGG